jgi:flagellar hook-length control protein FliK
MSTDLFYSQLVAQQFSSGKNLTSAAGGAASKSLRHSQSHDALESNEQGFLKTLERFSENQQPSQKSKPSDRDKMPVAEDSPSNSGSNNDISDSLNHMDNFIGANSHIHAENNVAAGGQNIDPANIKLLDLLKQLGIEFLLTNGNGRIDEPTVQGENAKSGVALEHETAVSTRLPSIDLAKLGTLLMHLHTEGNPNLSDENRRLVQLISPLSGNENLNSTKDLALENLFQDASGKSQGFQIDAESLKEVLKNIHDTQLVNEKTTVADLLKKIGSQLSRPSTPSQNLVSATDKNNFSGDTTDGDKKLLARLDAGWASKDISAAKNFKAQNLTEVIRLSSNPSKAPAQEIGQNVQKQLINSDLHGNPMAKSESTPLIFNHPSPVNNGSNQQTGKMTNLNPSLVSADKVVAKIFTTESDVKDGGLLFNQSQNEVKTPETKLVTPQTEIFQKDFRNQTVNQIVQKAVLHLKHGQSEVRLDLKPDFLGHIRMQIITESQQVTVRILTEYPLVKELIENNLPQLKSELQNHGLEIDELEVSVDHDADQHVHDRYKATQSKMLQRPDDRDQTADGTAEDAAAQKSRLIQDDENTRIDYFA